MHSRKQAALKSDVNPMREEATNVAEASIPGSLSNGAESEKLLPLHDKVGDHPQSSPLQAKKIGTALFYAVSSLGVIFANKIVLSTYGFPSVQTLALLQFTSTTLRPTPPDQLGWDQIHSPAEHVLPSQHLNWALSHAESQPAYDGFASTGLHPHDNVIRKMDAQLATV